MKKPPTIAILAQELALFQMNTLEKLNEFEGHESAINEMLNRIKELENAIDAQIRLNDATISLVKTWTQPLKPSLFAWIKKKIKHDPTR